MSDYRSVRNKWVRYTVPGKFSVGLEVLEDGSVEILAPQAGHDGETSILLSEKVAAALYNLFGDVMEWTSSKGVTENEINRLGEEEDHHHAPDEK